MKIIDCYWEQANLDCRVAEVSVSPIDVFLEEVLLDLEKKYDYIVLKLPVASFAQYLKVTEAQYVFIETQLSIQKKMDSWNLSPRDEKLLKHFSAKEVTNVSELEEVLSKIHEQMYTTDRIYLDPMFGPFFSAQRYRNWTRDAYKQGAVLLKYFFKNEEIGYGLLKIDNTVAYGLLGGIYHGEGMGIIVSTGALYVKERNFDLFKTKISTNNTPILRLYNHFNFEITNVEYVFVKHIKH